MSSLTSPFAALALALITLSASTPVAAQEAVGIGSLRAEAVQLLQQQDWSAAASRFRQLVEADSTSGIDWFRLGYALHQGGDTSDYPEAIRAMEKAAVMGAQVPSANFRRARMLAATGHEARAVAVLDTMVQGGFAQVDIIQAQPEFEAVATRGDFQAVVLAARKNLEPCMQSPESRQFDFWVGDWDVFAPAGPQVGSNHVERILRGCALLENWSNVGGREGKSLNLYDPTAGTWKQFWTDDSGWIVYYEQGRFEDDAMHMKGITYGPTGDTIQIRMDMIHESPDTVRQIIETSPEGEAWTRTFEGIYVRKGRNAPSKHRSSTRFERRMDPET